MTLTVHLRQKHGSAIPVIILERVNTVIILERVNLLNLMMAVLKKPGMILKRQKRKHKKNLEKNLRKDVKVVKAVMKRLMRCLKDKQEKKQIAKQKGRQKNLQERRVLVLLQEKQDHVYSVLLLLVVLVGL